METEEIYLKRMSLLTWLASFVILSKPSDEGMAIAWRWLAHLTNCIQNRPKKSLPLPTALATMYLSFLQVLGWNMNVRFKKQFRKVITRIRDDIVPVLSEDTHAKLVRSNLGNLCTRYLNGPQGADANDTHTLSEHTMELPPDVDYGM
jgi:hypothetical protein